MSMNNNQAATDRVCDALAGLTRTAVRSKKVVLRSALMIPCEGAPVRVQIQSKDAAEDRDAVLQASVMRLLCDQPGCEAYKATSEAMAGITGGGGYAMFLDGNRDYLDDQHACPAFFFLGADNGFPPAVPLARALPPNRNIGSPVRGPVLVYASLWVEDRSVGQYEKIMDWPSVEASTLVDADIFEVARAAVSARYADAGLLD